MQNFQANSDANLVWTWQGVNYRMPVTAKDILTLARAVNEEGYPAKGVAWTLIQRAAWARMHGSRIGLGKLVEAYAQPINPLWFPNGPKHQAEVARLTRLGKIAEANAEIARAAKRPAKATASWESLKPVTRQIIADIFTGKLSSPVPGAVHYWRSRGPDFETNQAAKPHLTLLDEGYGFGKGRNVFFAENGSEKFSGVGIDGLVKNAPWGAIIAGVGFAATFAWKWLKNG